MLPNQSSIDIVYNELGSLFSEFMNLYKNGDKEWPPANGWPPARVESKLRSLLKKHETALTKINLNFSFEILTLYVNIQDLYSNPTIRTYFGFVQKNLDDILLLEKEEAISQKSFALLCLINPFLIRNVSAQQVFTLIKFCTETISRAHSLILLNMKVFMCYRNILNYELIQPINLISLSTYESSKKYRIHDKKNISINDRVALSFLKSYFSEFLEFNQKLVQNEYEFIERHFR